MHDTEVFEARTHVEPLSPLEIKPFHHFIISFLDSNILDVEAISSNDQVRQLRLMQFYVDMQLRIQCIKKEDPQYKNMDVSYS